MRHPFDGILLANTNLALDSDKSCVKPATPDRRAVLGCLAAAGAALLGIRNAEAADAVTTQAVGEEGAGAVPPRPPGAKTTQAANEEAATTMAIPEGGVTTAPIMKQNLKTQAAKEAGIRVPEAGEDGLGGIKPGSVDVAKKDMEAAWKDLGDSDPNKANKSIRTLVSAKDGFTFMKENLKAEKTPDAASVEPLIKDLGSDKFDARETATAELKKLGPPVLPLLRDYLDKKMYGSDMEVKKRLEQAAGQIQDSPAMQQGLRGLEVLLLIGSKESRELLEEFSKADPKTWLSGPADGALKRVAK